MKPIKALMTGVLLLALLPAGSALGQSRGIALESKAVVQTTPFVGGVYRALIIGNDSYRDPQRRWPSLETAVSDARAVSRLLRRHYGFSDYSARAGTAVEKVAAQRQRTGVLRRAWLSRRRVGARFLGASRRRGRR
jgi:hypothetical protein